MVEGDTKTILSACLAVTFAPGAVETAALGDLARRLGFGAVAAYTPDVDIPRERLIFCIVHSLLPDATKQRVLRGLRTSENNLRRFAPIVCVVPKGPRHQIVPLVQMGFDEVLFLGDPLADMHRKLTQQLRQDILYVQTGHYFGPDRRRIELIDPQDPRRKPGGAYYKRLNVHRDPLAGISVHELS
ncbi:hypothetical protein [Devosia soli]|uniref:hypothetical protein n=1 Tax=Devosia soli TaxID=361041 RepID=UPI0006994A55|nr:hypothetical protein [Devosia soli]